MKLFDVNILSSAHRFENHGHEMCRTWLFDVMERDETFLYSEWVLSAFVRIVTNPRVYPVPTPMVIAMSVAGHVRSRPNGVAITPGERHWGIFEGLCSRAGVVGNLVPDAYLAALAIEANAEWVTSDADFERFEPDLNLRLLRG